VSWWIPPRHFSLPPSTFRPRGVAAVVPTVAALSARVRIRGEWRSAAAEEAAGSDGINLGDDDIARGHPAPSTTAPGSALPSGATGGGGRGAFVLRAPVRPTRPINVDGLVAAGWGGSAPSCTARNSFSWLEGRKD